MSQQTGVPMGTNRRTVHIGTNLFPDEMGNEGPPPLPEKIPEVQIGRQGEMEETLRAIKLLKLSYNGDRDPHLFLDSFKSHTNPKGYSDAVCCNMFQETLARDALSWFYELPSNSIYCFRELADKFVNRFILRTDGQNTAQLFKIKQDRGEVKIENLQGYDKLREMAIRHAQADHDTYGGTSAGKRKDEGRDGGSPMLVIQEVRAWKGEREPDSYPTGKRHKERN
ncbi:hypothetical protein ACLB2K_025783 [Fragaria x ananassa]